jgi:hypothetical protein
MTCRLLACLGLVVLLLPGCPATVDDDDNDDDDISGDDDSTVDEEPVARPDGADAGVPGWFVGMKARIEIDGELVTTPGVEVELLAPTSESRITPPEGTSSDEELRPLREARDRRFRQEAL